jgi:hypothetical protein
MEVSTKRSNRYRLLEQNKDVQPVGEQSFFSRLRDGFAIGAYGQAVDAAERFVAAGERTPGYDPLDHVPKGYEQYADSFMFARNQDEVDVITGNIQENLDIRQRQSELSLSQNLVTGLITGLLDPINLVPVPGLAGLGFVKGAMLGGVSAGSLNAAQEIVRDRLDPTSTATETSINIGIGYLAAGLISGGIGAFTKAPAGTTRLPPETRQKADNVGSRLDETFNAVDGLPSSKAITALDGNSVRIIDGNTGKFDADGNYIPIDYRSKASVESANARSGLDEVGAPTRSADDLLQEELSKPNPFEYDIDAPIGPTVYHGTRVSSDNLDSFVDANGNLVLQPGQNFGLSGISFGVQRQVAADYATRAGGGSRSTRNSAVFEVDADAVPNLQRETMGEAAVYTDGDIVIPAGKWRLTDAMTGEPINLRPGADDADSVSVGGTTQTSITQILSQIRGLSPRLRNLFHGYGRAQKGSVYSQKNGGPLFGSARYMSFSKTEAQSFGPNVVEESAEQLSFSNPLVVSSDDDWLALARSAGVSDVRNPTAADTSKLRAKLDADGIDGIVIAFDDGGVGNDMFNGKTIILLKNIFDQPQVVDLRRSFGPVEDAKVKAALPDAEDTITIDSSAILAGFESKPWTRPRLDGVEPLPEDAFKTKEDWLNFSILKELNQKTTPRLDSETVAAYENRINELAITEFKAGRLPLSPTTDSALESLAILPTPSGTLQRLAPDHVETHDLAQGIAGDHSTMTVANRTGRPTTPGGSVFQRAQRWMMSMYITRTTNNAAYVKYITGKETPSVSGNAREAIRIGLPLIGRAARQGKLTRAEFNAYVGRAANSDQPFQMFGKALSESDAAIVKQAAEQQRALYAQFEAKARDLGIFDTQARVSKEVEWRKAANERDLSRLEGLRSTKLRDIIRQEVADREAKIAELEQQIEEMKGEAIVPAGEQHYFPRIFDVGKIRANYDDFVKRIADSYGGDDAMARAKVTVDRILGEGGEEFVPGMGTPKHLKGRQIPLTNEELADYVVWDSELVMGLYARRMGATIEMFDRYGSRFLDKELDDLKAALRRDGYDEKRIRKILEQEEDLRDKVLGRFHGKDPMDWSNRVVRAVKNYTSLTTMGGGIKSQMLDVARTISTEGYKPVWQGMLTMFRGELKDFQRGSYTKEAGEAMELINARWMAQLIDNDSALTVTNQTALERGLAAAQSPFFQLNLMNPFTVIWKEFTSTIQTHVLLTEARQVAAAVRSGKTLATMSKKEQDTVARLNSWGIDLRTAQTIADMPVEKLEGGGLLLANMENWTGRDGERARDILLGAISGTARASTVTPGPLQRAAIMDGVFRVGGERKEFPVLSLPFQLMSFTMASSAKITHSMLSGRDRSVATTLTALIMGGAFATWLKSSSGFDYMEPEEFALNTLENSSVLGYLPDVYKRIEDISGYGPRAALGIESPGDGTVTEKVGAIGGPGPSVIAGMIEAFVSDSPDLSERERASMIRRAVPMSGLIWWDYYMKQLSNWAADSGMIEGGSGPSAEMDDSDFESVEIAPVE